MEDESGKIINEIERGRDRERVIELWKDADTIDTIKNFVSLHKKKNYLYYFVHEHRMKLFLDRKKIETDDSVIYCSGCSSTITDDAGAVYGCSQCKCFFHQQCAELPKEITHPCHKSHPLTLKADDPNSEWCLGCDLPVLAETYYGCITCSVYFHKFCLELPPKIKHWSNAQPTRLATAFHYLVLNYTGAAAVLKSRSTAFSYVCDKCDFATSIPECATRASGHILTLVPYPAEVTKRFHKFNDSIFNDIFDEDPYPTEVTKRFHNFNDSIFKIFSEDLFRFTPLGRLRFCFICGVALRSLGFFFCEACNLYVHVDCALPPTFNSDHHRHLLKLSDSDDHFCSISTDDDDYFCTHCEKQLHPGLPVYKCPENDCGGFVAHCYCEFLQGDVSICHIPGHLPIKRVVMIKDPVFSVQEVGWKWVKELTSFNDVVMVEGNDKVEKLFKDEDFFGCSELFAKYLKENKSRKIDMQDEYPFSFEEVEEVGGYLVAKDLAPILKGLFTRYGDFSAKSILPPKARLFVFNILCFAIKQICTTKQINKRNLHYLLDSLKVAACARFEIQFAVRRFKKAFLASTLDHLDSVNEQSVLSSDDDELDRIIRRIMKDEKRLEMSKSYDSDSEDSKLDIRIMPVVKNPQGESTGKPLELYLFHSTCNSWYKYLKSIKSKSIPEQEEKSYGECARREMLLWDYQSVMNNINRFIEQHCMTTNVEIETTTDFEVCGYGCELRTYNKGVSYHRCNTCNDSNIIQQTNLLRDATSPFCIKKNHDVTHFQDPPSDYGLDTIQYIFCAERFEKVSLFNSYSTWVNECCFVCDLPLWGASYNCEKHGNYFHKRCVQIPLDIQHFLHPLHRLALQLSSERCYVCGENCRGCAFGCSDCSFFVEVQCVFRKDTFKCESHVHLLTVIEGQSFYHLRCCSRCQMRIEQPFYLYCGLCNFSYHAKCVLPSTITCSHRHPLAIVESHMPDDSNEFYCTACEERIKPKDPVYHCFECNNYSAHIVCALSEMEPNDHQEATRYPNKWRCSISYETTGDPNKWCFGKKNPLGLFFYPYSNFFRIR